MKLLTYLITTLLLLTSVSALSMSGNLGEDFGERHTRSDVSCHFDVKLGTVCSNVDTTVPTFRQPVYRGSEAEECYFDRAKGAICPYHLNAQGAFRPRVYHNRADYNIINPPTRLTTPGPSVIKGDFKTRFTPAYQKAPTRLAHHFTN